MGLVGTALGLGAGLLFLTFSNPIKDMLIGITESEAAFTQFYQFAELPVHYETSSFVAIVLVSLTMSTLAGFVPALRAGMLKPAEALRYE